MSKNKNKTKCPLTSQERNKIYMEVVIGLMGINIWESADPAMKKFKIMMKLYLDTGKEFSGEIELETIGKKLIYTLYNDRQKKTVAYITKNAKAVPTEIESEPKPENF